MKKFICIALFAFVSALTVTSCTEEDVAPISEVENGGGGQSTDPNTKN